MNPLAPLCDRGYHPATECGRSSGVEHNLAKVRVGRSNRLARSSFHRFANGCGSGLPERPTFVSAW